MNLSSSHIVVTGGASGLGLATAKHLSELGAQLTLLDQDEASVSSAADEIGAVAFVGDVADESLREVIECIVEKSGPIHGLVSCAGIADSSRIIGDDGAMCLNEFERVVRVNLIGSFNVIRLVAEQMVTQPPDENGERGAIVNTASIAATDGQVGQAAYAASKAGVHAMALPVARELAKFGIRINTIAPGIFRTPLLNNLPDQAIKTIETLIPFPRRLGEPIEFAQLAEFCLTHEYLNAEIIRLDGAVRMPPY